MAGEMNYATVCSGIGAPEVAWRELWGAPEFTSEIEPFPSAVLKHHMPDVPNYGDMTKYKEWPQHENLGLICGGTPCQSFSVAGLRKGMDDPRGNLTLTFLGLLARYNPRWFVWENVPGVLSSGGGRDFAGFLRGLQELGYSCAYRVLDAQYFGVPQRRRRVFVVGHLGADWRPPFAVLTEPESMRGNTPPGRKEGEGVAECFEVGPSGGNKCEVTPTLDARCKDGPIRNQIGALVFMGGQGAKAGSVAASDKISPTLRSSDSGSNRTPCVAVHARQTPITVEDCALPLEAKGGEQAIAIHPHAIGRKDEAGPQAKPCRTDGKAYTHDSRGVAQAVAFSGRNRGPEPKCNRPERPPHAMIELTGALEAIKPWNVAHDTIVRRLTPMECEFLQGFPRNFTKIPWRGKEPEQCPDGPRYKALGNSMAVPVLKWIGERIQLYESLQLT